jgi:predicted nucleic acid-binding protein
MILYLDTSAVVKLYVEEDGSSLVRSRVESAEVVTTSRIAYAETRAAMASAARQGRITSAERSVAVAAFRADWRSFSVVNVTQEVVELAADLAEDKALRGYDAVHLASAVLLLHRTGQPVRFLSWDRRLNEAATEMDLTAEP